MGKKQTQYNKRYKHKLNMLEPGSVMIKITGALFLLGIVLYFLSLKIACIIAFLIAGLILLILLILVAVELHQDKVLNEIAARENKENNLKRR